MSKDQGYSTDQFLGFENYESSPLSRTPDDNPEFAYPGNRMPNIYDQPWDQTTNTLVQRGFIRGIIPEILSDSTKTVKGYENAATSAPKRRCFFQFNPSLILRSVQASTTVLNPLLQPASELLQPIPGQAAFEFQLLFNREREVSNHKMASGFESGDPVMSSTSFYNNSLAAYGSKGSEYNQNHVSDLGVLADLYILDSIIGQSITQDAISSLQSYWDLTQKNKGSSTSTVENQDGTTTTIENKKDGSVVTTVKNKKGEVESTETVKSTDGFLTQEFTSEDTKKKLEGALGNSAFLSPLPVRIVFSSLFMVEGFVTSSNVAFHKFSAQMVPTVCTVTLNVQALYLGFAKKESYVSKQLATQLATSIQNDIDTTKNQKAAQKALADHFHLKLSFLHAHGNLDTLSLNQWVNRGTTENWKFPNGSGFRFDSGDSSGLQVYLDYALTDLVSKAAVQNIKVDSVELLFIDKDNLPKNFKTAEQIKEGLEKGTFPPPTMRGPTNPKQIILARADINIVDSASRNSADTDTSNGMVKIESANIEKSTKTKPYSTYWQSANLSTYSTTPTTFFKDNLIVALVVAVTADYPGATSDTAVASVRVVKSSILMSVDPNTTAFLNSCKKASSNGASVLNFEV